MSDEQETGSVSRGLTHDDLNGALKSQRKDFEKAMLKMQEQTAQLIQSLQSALGPKPDAPQPMSRNELSEDVQELKKQNKFLMDQVKAREESEKRMKLESQLRETLNKSGIKSRDEIAMKYLKDQVSFDEDGQLVLKVDDGPPLPLRDGVNRFLQTEHGKFLADSKEVRGSVSSNQSTNYNAPRIDNSSGLPSEADAAKRLIDQATAFLEKNQLKF